MTTTSRLQRFVKITGPGVLFASVAIGTSHLVLSTRAGAHYGLIAGLAILAALGLKYPFYEFGTRYANVAGKSLVHAYHKQGAWVMGLFAGVVFLNMFSVTAAIAGLSAGLLSSLFGVSQIPILGLVALILGGSLLLMVLGKYRALDGSIKLITGILVLTVLVAFAAVLVAGPIPKPQGFEAPSILSTAALATMIGLIGFMPAGMEASAMTSIWTLERYKSSGYRPTLKEALAEFNTGYLVTGLLAFMFLVVGAFTVFGSGQILEGNATVFSTKIIEIFTQHTGSWSFLFVALSAFTAVYGTLLTAWDGFVRCLVEVFTYWKGVEGVAKEGFQRRSYIMWLSLVGIVAFLIISLFRSRLILLLDIATIIAFVSSPVISLLNLRAVTHKDFPSEGHPPGWMKALSYLGIVFLMAFTGLYVWSLL